MSLVTSLLSTCTSSSSSSMVTAENPNTSSKKRPAAANFSAKVGKKLVNHQSHRMNNCRKKGGFCATQVCQWCKMFEELLQFKEEIGHCRVPFNYPKNPVLGSWVKRQRYQYKLKVKGRESSMTDARIVALEDIGFVWCVHKDKWWERFHEMEEYSKLHGDCNVVAGKGTEQLYRWVQTQRREFKKLQEGLTSTSMTEKRIKALEKLGFVWTVKSVGQSKGIVKAT